MHLLALLLMATEPAAEPAAAASVDYTPAFIGLLGVIVGGLIQVWFQAFQARKQDRHRIREQVAEYATTLAMALDYLEDLVIDYELTPHTGEPFLSSETREHSLERVRELWPALHGQHAALIACSDSRLARQALRANNITSQKILPAWWAVTKDGDLDGKLFTEGTKEVREIRTVLLRMVKPQEREKVRGFRSAETVRKDLAKNGGDLRR